MPRKRTIKPATDGKKEGAAIGIFIRLSAQEISVLERIADSENRSFKDLLQEIALEAIEKRAKEAETSN